MGEVVKPLISRLTAVPRVPQRGLVKKTEDCRCRICRTLDALPVANRQRYNKSDAVIYLSFIVIIAIINNLLTSQQPTTLSDIKCGLTAMKSP